MSGCRAKKASVPVTTPKSNYSAARMEKWIDALEENVRKGKTKIYQEWEMVDEAVGVGFVTAPRGALSHWIKIVDTLIYCELIGNSPDTVVIGIQPADLQTMSMQLSPAVNKALPEVMRRVLQEVVQAGGEYWERG